jgi:hypothetical protein
MHESADKHSRTPARLDLAEWERLAREDPPAFERRRREAIEAVIAHAPEAMRPRLRGLQFRIDLERMRAKTPLGAALRLHSMMWDKFQALHEALDRLAQADLRAQVHAPARVIPFRPRD